MTSLTPSLHRRVRLRLIQAGVCQAYDSRDGTWHPGKFFRESCNDAWSTQEKVAVPKSSNNVPVLVKN